MNVMVVDDAMFMRTVLKKTLQELGHNVPYEAENGRIAVETYKAHKDEIDLVTLDITMPELDGLGALKELKAFDPNVKCVMVTAMGQQDMVVQAASMGIVDFVVKPFQKEKIDKILEKVKSMG